ncbi:hypothetical protein AAV94_08105 [Lampropedia cohaerens]|uniref:Chorismate-utilising enzyme C-terminal domain-containing protein n=1 Tax=Lampropedia cohaerens TaxID=1610491 RepID=A0A0U1PZD3_9BURK|nr:bifunctional anthranilate synthase component I family protein/class IV aminotransferase [Lampropedia cohaerens]KKW67874.1 hypothetical protein AAV94_08105 [Lampropedia cohaerens]
MTHPAFALLDDHHAPAERAASRLYTRWQGQLCCDDATQLDEWQARLHAALAQGLHAVLLADYEWGLSLHGLTAATPQGDATRPQLRAELFEQQQLLRQAQVSAWLNAQCPPQHDQADAGLLGWRPGISQQQHAAQLAEIHAAIARGDTYQVNHTFAFEGRAWGSPIALYRSLRSRQRAEFGALLHLPHASAHAQWVLSLSPELFVQVKGRRITARPMKGTAPAGHTPQQMQASCDWLRSDAKNRAENVMIVDLLRNDLGRVARTGSVHVPQLFAVQRNDGVLSMTSTIEAELREGVDLADVLRATFPCGSITGAPKRKTMALIAQIEGHGSSAADARPYHRGLYTGAIGWAALSAHDHDTRGDPQKPTLDYCLSVPIRTLFLDQPERPDQPRRARLPVGAGITWDSRAEDEWRECHLKARFAQHAMAGFALFETMLLPAGAALPAHWHRHCARLTASAQELGFCHALLSSWEEAVQAYIARHHAERTSRPAWRLRMALQQDGTLALTHAVLDPLPHGPVSLTIAPSPSRVPAWLRRHKTTLRADYDAALRQAMAQGAFDALFFNEAGFLTEGARSNVFVRMEDGPDAPWLTPPLSDGVLPGVMRSVLLDDPAWPTREQQLRLEDLRAARAILVTNSLRGALPARLL